MKVQISFIICAVIISGLNLNSQVISYNNQLFIPETNPVYVPASQAADAKPGYTMVFSDEFEYTSTNQLAGKWDTTQSGHSTGVFFRTKPSTTSLVINDQGTKSLRLLMNKLTAPIVSGSTNYYYEGGLIKTKRRFIYGYFEARIKLNVGRGAWPAFWLYGNNGFNNENMPAYMGTYNEIDIMECGPDFGSSRLATHSAHAWRYDSSATNCDSIYWQTLGSNERYYTGDKDLGEEYHIYALDFTPTSIVFFVDGVQVGSITGNQTFIDKLKKQAMMLTLDNGIYLDRMDHTSLSSNAMDIDYVRVYEKNQTIALSTHTCSSGNLATFVATNPDWYSSLPTNRTISYQWSSLTSGVTISGSSITNTVTISNPSNIACTIKCRVIVNYPEWYISSGNQSSVLVRDTLISLIKYPNIFTNTFTIGTPTCISNQIQCTVTQTSSPPGGLWQIWNTDANGNISGSPLPQNGYGTSFTFTNLTAGTTYAVTRGTWDACTPWGFTQKNFKTSVTEFSISSVTCTGNGNKFQFTATAFNSIVGATWQLYPCDANGVVPIGATPVNGSGISWTFNNLNPDSYYKLTRAESGSCTGGSSTVKIIYVPDFLLNPNFESTVIPNSQSINFAVNGTADFTSPVSWWGIYNSDASGAPISQIGNTQAGGSASFGLPNYSLYDGNWYLVVHAAYGECSLWNWRGHLIMNNTRHGGGTTIQEIELDSMQKAQLTEQLESDLAQSGKNRLHCYPNPGSDNMTIEIPEFETAASIELYDAQGRLLFIDQATSSKYNLDIRNYPGGIYYIRTSDGEKTYSEIIVKE